VNIVLAAIEFERLEYERNEGRNEISDIPRGCTILTMQ
jgi:hypothetical protein